MPTNLISTATGKVSVGSKVYTNLNNLVVKAHLRADSTMRVLIRAGGEIIYMGMGADLQINGVAVSNVEATLRANILALFA